MRPTKPSRTNRPHPPAPSPMDVDYLQRIVKLMEGHDLNTVELQEGEKRVVLKRGASALPAAPVSFVAPAHVVAPAPPDAPVAPTAAPAPASEEAGLVAIKSPMVGTFYAAPSPDARPFVSVGDPVDEDTDVCVIEAMKVFNNIKAECRGTIAKLLGENGSPVEFGQVLFLVKP